MIILFTFLQKLPWSGKPKTAKRPRNARNKTQCPLLSRYTESLIRLDEQNSMTYYCFFRGHGNESCNLIGPLPGQYFPISAHGPW